MDLTFDLTDSRHTALMGALGCDFESRANVDGDNSSEFSPCRSKMTEEKNKASLDEPFVIDIKIDRDSSTALHQQISTPLENMIASGELPPGQIIEDEVSLAKRLEISRPTVRRAMQDLVSKGLLSRRRGVGTRVSPSPFQRQIKLSSLTEDFIDAGHTTRTEVLRYEVRFANEEIAENLACDTGDEIVFFERLRWLDNSRLALMQSYVPSDIAPSLTDLDRDGFYRCLAASGVQLSSGYQQVGAKNASEREAKLLHLEPGSAVVTMRRTSYDTDGRIVEFAHHCYDAAQYTVTVPLTN